MKKINKLLVLSLAVLLVVLNVNNISASNPYKTLTVDGDGRYVETQTAYIPNKVITKISDLSLRQPSDIKMGFNGNLYIADSGNARIVISSVDGELIQTIGEGVLRKPSGVAVSKLGNIFVADEGLLQVIKFSPEGEVLHVFEKPTAPSFGKVSTFTPLKIIVDDRENVYVTSRGNYNGMIMLNEQTPGEFLGYFAPNTTSISWLTGFRKLIFTEDQLSRMMNVIPNSPANITIDDRGLIYSVTPQDKLQTIKKLNMAGRNIIQTKVYDTYTSAIEVGPLENIFVTSSTGYIYEYTSEGKLLFIFGGSDVGRQRPGLFSNAVGIVADEKHELYVLDQKKGEIQSFIPTEFADLVHEALELYQTGNYLESKEPWEQVLKINSLFDFANLGIAEAHFKDENYKEALEFYTLAKDVPGYSDAYWEVRNVWIRENIISIILIVTAYVLIVKILKFIQKKYQSFDKIINPINAFKSKKLYKEIMFVFYFIKHPLDGSYGIRKEKKTSNMSALFIALVIIAIGVFDKYGTGFVFSTVRSGQYSLVKDVGMMVVVYLFMVGGTYLVTTITDGESKFRNLAHSFIYAFAPYILIKPFVVILSNYLTLNEQFIISFTNLIVITWVLVNIFIVIQDQNNYTFKETIRTIFLSLFTIFIGILLMFILYMLIGQLFSFIESLFGEVVYRIESRR